jgi:hypothetical protein
MKDVKKDFADFVSDAETSAGPRILNQIYENITRPSPWTAATKLGVAHVLSSFLTLMACSQFGVRLFFPGHGLMHYFMQVSPTFCMTFCGALYFACTFLFARAIFTYDEFLLIIRNKVLSILSVGFISLGAFALVSHEVTFEAGILWLFGAIVGAELASLRTSTIKKFLASI